MRSIKDLDVAGKKVLVRVDFNVPLQNNQVADDYRLITAFPTIRYLLEKKARIILLSHLGRPEGKIVEKLRLAPVAKRVQELLGYPVQYVNDCIGPAVQEAVSRLKEGDILLLENLRFYPGEEKNDPDFARELAKLGEVYINDAFSAAHRAHASTYALARLLPSGAGFLMEKEVNALSKIKDSPDHPFVVVLGGAKVSDKIGIINNLIDKADYLLIGGGMAFTFLCAQNTPTGKSLVETDKITYASELLKRAGEKIILPVDVIAAPAIEENAPWQEVSVNEIPPEWMGLDIGSQTIAKFVEIIGQARSVFWNGPVGVFEIAAFSRGTHAIREAIAANKKTTVIGGGDTASAVADCLDRFTHVSTGGGASLEFLEGRVLPGIAALES